MILAPEKKRRTEVRRSNHEKLIVPRCVARRCYCAVKSNKSNRSPIAGVFSGTYGFVFVVIGFG